VCIICREREDGEKKKLISNTMPKRTRPPLTPLAVTRDSALYGEYCLCVCVCVCARACVWPFFRLKVGMQTSIGNANTAPLPGSSRALSALLECTRRACAPNMGCSLPARYRGCTPYIRVTPFALPTTKTVFGNSIAKNYSSLFTEWTDFI
jgi:hypothetical protein